ncbi:Carnitine O-acetyltransferase [Zancudomyces culisetae]|uniref:Carnitine O-acetyltransferase n=1 Tax=Zancudomyces culisetae TaxID=1213189 RepID=A0A1R1PJX4_ZANCU|nr:Carnitine O-acetyltransferase [Zancudomyces culisetae]|eukprot:OMH81223.1 Carnitine O-acetyltransferase [Zancudomyces culisetae]
MAIIRRVFDNDKKLPRLPLPPVRQTMERYYESLQPLFTESELLEIKKKIDEFLAPKHQVIGENGEKQMVSTADVLQKRLVEYEKTQQYSWLELWWEEMAYLGWREPLFINSNYWVSIFPHPKPYGQIGYKELGIKTRMEPGRAVFKNVGYSEFQIRVAASMINKAVEFKDMLDNEQLPSHLVGSKPMCMNQFKNLFGVTRLPRPERDEIYKYTGYIKYIIVMVRNQIYRVPIYTEKGKRLLDGDMEDLLNRVVEDAQSLKDSELEPPIGIISAGHRDRWAAAYAELAQHNNPTAQATLQEIQHSAFAVSLEDFCVPKERDEASFQRLLKSGANSGHNRWYDKHISMIFDRNGNYGAMGEHSPADAVVPAYLHEYVATQTYNSKVKLEKDRGSPSVFRSVGSDD